jgi:eukaryotic-like serine/threonine-protein kinase
VDQRTDIYALGATLYELLTLEPVFPGQQRLELLQQIARREPAAPRRIAPTIPVDLETIVLKALAKNPAERYQTAAELAGDLQRFLDDKAIQARRPTLRQRAGRWVRRHAVAVRAAGVVLALAVIGLVASTALIWNSREETRAALVKAERSQQLAEAAVNDMYTEVAEKWLEQEPQSDPLQREFLLKALEYFKEFARQNSESPQLTQKTALALKRAGVIQYKFGQDAEAEANLSAAIGLLNSLAAASPESAACRRELASCHNARAIVLRHLGKLQEAEREFSKARDIVEQMLKHATDEPALQYELARYCVNRAALLIGAGRFPEAEKEFDRAVEIDTRLAGQNPGVSKYRFDLAKTQSNRGILWWKIGRLDEAEKAWQEAIRLARELSAADPRQRQHREIGRASCRERVSCDV